MATQDNTPLHQTARDLRSVPERQDTAADLERLSGTATAGDQRVAPALFTPEAVQEMFAALQQIAVSTFDQNARDTATAALARAVVAKSNRVRDSARGIRKVQFRPLVGTKASGIKLPMKDRARPIDRETGQEM